MCVCVHEVCVSVHLCIYKCKGERGGAALVLEKTTADPTPWAEFPSLDSSVGVSKLRMLGDTQPTTSGISQFSGVTGSQPPRNSQEGEEHGRLSIVSWGEVVLTSESCNKAGRRPLHVSCVPDEGSHGPRLGWKSVSVISLKDSLHQDR